MEGVLNASHKQNDEGDCEREKSQMRLDWIDLIDVVTSQENAASAIDDDVYLHHC